MTPDGVQGVRWRAALHQAADVDRVKSVDVLRRIDRVEYPLRGAATHPRGQRRLDEDAVVRVAVVQSPHQLQQLVE